nr:MAG TPA: hypothetical protein [Caudoviricetes sp.]
MYYYFIIWGSIFTRYFLYLYDIFILKLFK